LVVVDSKKALISTGNFNITNLCDLDYSPNVCNRDYSYITDDPEIVSTLQQIVEKDLAGKKYDVDSVVSADVSKKITVGPNSLKPLISFLQTAKKSIQIENQYLKEPTINSTLIAAAKKGIEVQVLVASACSFGRPRAGEASRITAIYTEFDEAGITTRMFTKNNKVNGKPGYMHAKAIVIDGKKAWVGSVNGSTQGTTMNREFGIFFDDPSEIKKIVSTIDKDFSDSNVETWQESLECAENKRN
jgi:phosphatidylserine/phosphatidylglycerophosphate/cardiolipin synthase-like enzyme